MKNAYPGAYEKNKSEGNRTLENSGFRRLPAGLRHRHPPVRHTAFVLVSAVLAAVLATAMRQTVGTLHPIPLAVIVLGVYGIVYLALTWVFRVPQARALTQRRD